MIPKLVHLYWGNDTLSFLRYVSIASVAANNPDWNVILYRAPPRQEMRRWTSNEGSDKDLAVALDYWPRLPRLRNLSIREFPVPQLLDIDPRMADVHIKDLLSWYILSTIGGFVADTDIIFFRSFEYLRTRANFQTAEIALTQFTGFPKAGYIPVTLMGSSGNSDFFTDVLKRDVIAYEPTVYGSCGSNSRGISSLEEIEERYPTCSVCRLPNDSVYPIVTSMPWLSAVRLIHEHSFGGTLPDDAIGLHWHGGAPESRESNALLTHENVESIDTTIAQLAASI